MLLKIGSTGEAVKKLQTLLGLTADGSFGALTEANVKQWQAANGLKVDGVVGDISWAKMFPNANTSNPASSPETIDLSKLNGIVPSNVLAQLPDIIGRFSVTSLLRLAHFLAQCGHESAGFSITSENLNYSADRIQVIFAKYFHGISIAAYAHNPAKLGARVYAKRMGNGDEASGEGYTFRGRGYIQLTGKDNYSHFAQFIGVDTVANPDLVASKYALASAAFFFEANNVWETCDTGTDLDAVTAVTKKVNGGTLGLDERNKLFNKYYAALKKA